MKNTTRGDIFFKNTPRPCRDVWHCQTYEHSFCPRQKSEPNQHHQTSEPSRAVIFIKLSDIKFWFMPEVMHKWCKNY